MANIKLKDHYWETEGIYDVAQSKTQKAINADIEEVAQNNSDLIIMSDTQPSATGNKIWIKEGVSYQIPVMDDLISNNITNNSSVTGTKVTDALNTLGSNVSDLQGSLNSKVLKCASPISIPSSSQVYTMNGITTDHVLIQWNFNNGSTVQPENSPPCDLQWATGNDSSGANKFTITNVNQTSTSWTIQPVFAIPVAVTAT